MAGSIAAWDRANLQSTEFAANAVVAKPVKAIVPILMQGCFIFTRPLDFPAARERHFEE
ncbi:hypothetical protein GGD65_004557 [Bradyrhizobium sp. CIR18]|uniref:hypothetical protein n=1 Tax=Bradyrhizobium sp. CIR18 TaxID=2663839 RepID=UPI0017C56720|nr:hypothetical protein [Bradyrhizobium sp. CIR18]MBB4363512.1 hypothetical protein [Bradyrhizobium sp. CIR18]